MRATLGITTGDPAGIGLEIVLRSLHSFLPAARFVLFTDRSVFEQNARAFAFNFPVRWIDDLFQVTDDPVLFLKETGLNTRPVYFGEPSAETGRRALEYLDAASAAALRDQIHAIVTAPVSKEAIGGGFRGQTDFLAAKANRREFAMAFFAPTFKVVLATIHLSLREAISRISTHGYVDLIRFTNQELIHLGFARTRIAVAAINPHAGEGGIFGREDLDILRPAVEACAAEGIVVSGPYPADSLYSRAHKGEFDLVIAPYHDQGLIPIKLAAQGRATNVTLGLPYVRTSPDHGTAFTIAGKGKADPAGMESAIRCALDLVERTVKE
jgi:4-hydroxythreonine-4-phosphate dehydrogenase